MRLPGTYISPADTGLYYCNSRYYDANTGRFINGDSQLNTSLGVLGCNMYAYCLNNPVRKADYDGKKPGDLFDTIDEAAIDFAMNYNGLSIELNIEYATSIYSVTERVKIGETKKEFKLFGIKIFSYKKNIYKNVTKYTYTTPKYGDAENVAPRKVPLGKTTLATAHTHAAYSPDPGVSNEEFTPADREFTYQFDALRCSYLVTPNGLVKKVAIWKQEK